MTVIGSYKDDMAFDKTRISLMNRDVVSTSVDKLQEVIRDFTPFQTGRLRESIKTTDPKRVAAHTWQAKVYTDLEYAAAIEYGMSPKWISPKKRQALQWAGEGGVSYFSEGHMWPGYQGSHMFQKGAALFERAYAEDIAEDKARLWLGSVDAGRRTVVI